MKPLAIAPLALTLTSCASIMAQQQPITITSSPSGTRWIASDGQRGVTPRTVRPRDYREDFVITFERPGYETQTVTVDARVSSWTAGNILFFPAGIIGFIFDAYDPKAHVYTTSAVHVDLVEMEAVEDE